MDTATAARPHRHRRWPWLLLLLPLVLSAGALLLLDSGYVAEKVKGRALPLLSGRMGRAVTAGEVELKLFPPRVAIEDVKVAGGASEPAFLEAGEVSTSVRLWPLVRSFGKDLQIDEVKLHAPVIRLVRRADGTWSHAEVSESLERTAKPEGAQSPARDYEIDAVVVEDGVLELIDHTAGGATLAITDLDAETGALAPGEPVDLEARAAVLSSAQNLTGTFKIDPLPEQTGGAQDAVLPKVNGKFEVQQVPLARLEPFLPAALGRAISGGQVRFEGTLGTEADGAYHLGGPVAVEGARMRGQPASGRFDLRASTHPSNFDRMELRLEDLELSGPGVQLAGSATMTTAPDKATFTLAGPLLDLDQLLGALPADEPAADGAAGGEQALVTPKLRGALAGVSVDGTLKVEKVVNGKLTAQNLSAEASLRNGQLIVQRGDADLYGGKLDLGGSRIDLLAPKPKWDLEANARGLDLAQAMGALSQKQPLRGALTLSLKASGAGNDWTELSKAVTGGGLFELQDGALTSADLGQALGQALSAGLAKLGATGAAEAVAAGTTELKDLSASFRIEDGFLALTRPLAVNTRFGTMTLGGRIGLDQRLDLSGKVLLEPQFVAKATGGKLNPGKPVEVPVGIGGTLSAPALSRFDPASLVISNLPLSRAQDAVKKQRGKVEEEVTRQARRKLEGLFGR